MWQLLKLLSVPAFLIGGVFAIYGLVKLGKTDDPPKTKIESGAADVEITRLEPAKQDHARGEALTILIGAGLVMAASVVAFGYASVKGRSRPMA
jgi:hypothetical protein